MKLITKLFGVSAATIAGASLIGVALAAKAPVTEIDTAPPVITPQPEYDRETLLAAIDADARERELAVLKQYEQADFEFMRGDAELPEK